MESSESYSERRAGPTVSKEKWLNHARTKLSRGYVLILGRQRRNANFYLRSKGFEMCPYHVAKHLVSQGLVVEAGQHPLGTMYRLAEDAAPLPKPAAPRREAEEDPPEEDLLAEADLNDVEDTEALDEGDDLP